MIRPRGTPPTPRARSSARAPVEIEATFRGPSSPMRMIEPLPNCFSIWETAFVLAVDLHLDRAGVRGRDSDRPSRLKRLGEPGLRELVAGDRPVGEDGQPCRDTDNPDRHLYCLRILVRGVVRTVFRSGL